MLNNKTFNNSIVQAVRLTSKEGNIVSDNASIDVFKDGLAYELPNPEFSYDDTMAYSRVAIMEKIVVKLATSAGFSEYKNSLQVNGKPLKFKEVENNKSYTILLEKYPELGIVRREFGGLRLHFLLEHRAQYDRLQQQDFVVIPKARFVILLKRMVGLLSYWQPAVIQSKVSGITLWDMIAHENRSMRPEYTCYHKMISEQLLPLAKSELAPHINWNIKNFIFNETTGKLHYVDSKPSAMIDQLRNRQNLRNIKKDFAL